MEESLGNPRDSLYFKGFHGTIYSRENGRILQILGILCILKAFMVLYIVEKMGVLCTILE